MYSSFRHPLLLLSVVFAVSMTACIESKPNLNKKGTDKLKSLEVENIGRGYQTIDTVYVPIYSDIYSETKSNRFLLTATLSIRNTSMTDSLYIETINYYDTSGKMVRSYVNKTLRLKPLESIDYVIEEQDKAGGTGANFIIVWGAKSKRLNPLFQGVMISTMGQQGISFITDGVSISKKKH